MYSYQRGATREGQDSACVAVYVWYVMQLCAAVRAVVSASVRGQVPQCMYATVCTTARGRGYVTGRHAAMCGCPALPCGIVCAAVCNSATVCSRVR